jgi:hypothetical protein
MSNNRLMNLGDPLGVQDAVNLEYLGRFLKLDGSSVMAGALNMGGHDQCRSACFGGGCCD